MLNLLQRLNEVKGQIWGCWRLWLPRQKHGLYIKSRFKCIFVYELRNHQITIIIKWRCGTAVGTQAVVDATFLKGLWDQIASWK